MARVRFEQAVYGSFPFWDRGYALLAASPGCPADRLREFEAICQRYGMPSGSPPFEFTGALFALRMAHRGPWLIVRVAPQGVDDHGRPGALAFHGLFVSPSELRKSPLGPFGLVGALRSDWTAADTTLPSGAWEVPPSSSVLKSLPPEQDALREPIAAALVLGRKVALESPVPITLLARTLWRMDPTIPQKRSFATLAGSTAIPFDLVALPRLAGVDLGQYLTPETLPAFAARSEPRTFLRIRRGFWPALGGGILLLAVWLANAYPERRRPNGPPAAPVLMPYAPATGTQARSVALPPVRPASVGPENPDVQAAVAEGLRDFAARYVVDLDPPGPGSDDPTPLIRQIADQLRYRGAFCLDPHFRLGTLDRDAQRLATVQVHLQRHFTPERPLPGDLELGSLRWQLEVLAWSYNVPLPPGLEPAEIPFHLAEALRIPSGPKLVPPDLATRYPMLMDQAAFVANRPRRSP